MRRVVEYRTWLSGYDGKLSPVGSGTSIINMNYSKVSCGWRRSCVDSESGLTRDEEHVEWG
jgi:hypothetical protein